MSGKFTNLIYDKDAYDERLQRSTDPLSYRIDSNFSVNCCKCFAPFGPVGGNQNAAAMGKQIDVDSILRGVSRINSKSNRQQMPDPISGYEPQMPHDCSSALEPEYTRYTYPSYDIRGLATRDLRFDYPLFDPQCQIFENFEVNTRLQAKDNHRAIWQVPMNQRDLLPTERLGRVKNCQVSKNCNYAPFVN
jgi:hypothetical protein